MSTPESICFCTRAGCTGSKLHGDKVMKNLLPFWQNAIRLARNGFDEPENNEHAYQIAQQISAELEHCTSAIKDYCATFGIYANKPEHVGRRDLGQ